LLDISENDHVLTVPRNKHSKSLLLDDTYDFARVSTKQASTFYGICADHDHKLFNDIENDIRLSYRTFLGLAERTILYEAIESTKNSLWSFYLLKYAKFDFHFDMELAREELENMRHYAAYAWSLLGRLQSIRLRNSAREFKFVAVEFEEILPFCGTGCFCIELGFDGSRIQDFSKRQKFNYAQISITRSSEGRTLFLLSGICDERPKAAKRLLSSLLKQPRETLGDAALRAMIVHTENVYFRPSWLNSIDKPLQSEILRRYNYGTDFLVGQVKASDTLSTPLVREFSPRVAAIKHNLGKRA